MGWSRRSFLFFWRRCELLVSACEKHTPRWAPIIYNLGAHISTYRGPITPGKAIYFRPFIGAYVTPFITVFVGPSCLDLWLLRMEALAETGKCRLFRCLGNMDHDPGFKDSTFWYVQNKANSEHMVSCGFIM